MKVLVMMVVQCGAAVAMGGWLLGGPRLAGMYALPFLIFLALIAAATWLDRRKDHFVRATLTQDGVTFRDLHFGWNEIKSVSRPRPLPGVWLSPLKILLNRPRKFWTFKGQPTDRVTLPASLWQQPPFLNELKSRLPQSSQRALEDAPPIPWQYGLIPLACAVSAAGLGILLAANATGWFVQAVLIIAVLTAGAAAGVPASFWAEDESTAADLLKSAFYPLFFWGMLGFFLFVVSGRLPLLVGMLIGLAAACSLLGIMLFAGCRKVRWSHVGALYALAAAGFLAGWFGYGGIPDVAVAEGTIGYRNPWTPSGDGFLVSLADSREKATSLRWYSADLKPESDVQVPQPVHVTVVGQDSALCRTGYVPKDERKEIWFICRQDSAVKRLLSADACQVNSASPSRNYAVVWSEETGENRTWYLVSMSDGLMRPFALPPGFDGANVPRILAPRDDGALLLLKGSLPLDKGKNRVTARTELPESGEFPYPGQPFSIWLWNPFGEDAPRQLYATKEQWLDYRLPSLCGFRIYVCRLATPPHKEYFSIDLTKIPLAESLAREEAFRDYAHDPSASGARFSVSEQKMKMFLTGRLVVTDNRTGRARYLRAANGPLGNFMYFLSPAGDKLLVEVLQLPAYFPRKELGAEPTIRSTVHFIDLAAAFR